MATNVYLPKVGGVARSIEGFARAYRAAGHDVTIMAPSFEGQDETEPGVLRIPALHELLDGTYSLAVPYPGLLIGLVRDATPDVVHAHHPFLLGATGHKLAATAGAPIVYTHHTRFDAYGHYFPSEHGFLQTFVQHLSVHFSNLCDAVIAPGTEVRDMLREAGVTQPIEIIPTGVDAPRFAGGDGRRVRRELGIGESAPVIGHVGRLAKEKNLAFLASAVARALAARPEAHLIVGGDGPLRDELAQQFAAGPLAGRVHFLGLLDGQALVDCYAAMDLFAFASHSETQGMVITEAMAAGVPVIAVDAAGVEDVLVDGRNGLLLPGDDEEAFAAAIERFLDLPLERRETLRAGARATADEQSMERCSAKALALYERLIADRQSQVRAAGGDADSVWDAIGRRLTKEFQLLGSVSRAVRDSFVELNFD
jgi:glycosyltransferase involved in cell wall biosynthesis